MFLRNEQQAATPPVLENLSSSKCTSTVIDGPCRKRVGELTISNNELRELLLESVDN